jgi:two-component system sensor histidine kinase DesK
MVGGVSTSSHPTPPASTPGARQLARGISATWWYTATAIVFFELMLVLGWMGVGFSTDRGLVEGLTIGIGGIVWCASTVLLLKDYRHRSDAEPGMVWRTLAAPLAIAVLYGILAGFSAQSWQLALMPVAQSLVLLNWPRGVRYRVVIAITLVLVALAYIDTAQRTEGSSDGWWLAVVYTTILPAVTVSSLWWWDVLHALDRARASEARLAATQERLRVATDVHDLQGHHLQVIALQLELAERLMPVDADAGMEQLRAARVSVDEARQGTRDLATRFRSVPLGDELANARDLLSAAGLAVDADIAPDASAAPASALGPIIRETTTNVLRHGGGTRARLTLRREAAGWRYEIANDVGPEAGATDAERSGIDGMRRRVREVDGSFDVRRDADEFVVTAIVPDTERAQ